MVLPVSVDLNELFRKGRQYPWTKPKRCPHCNGGQVWGHGFVTAFFDGIGDALFLKRFRCPLCRTVFRTRPSAFFSRFQARTATIRASITLKASQGKWLNEISRTRQNHWYRGLLRHITACFGNTWDQGMVAAFDALAFRGITPVKRRI